MRTKKILHNISQEESDTRYPVDHVTRILSLFFRITSFTLSMVAFVLRITGFMTFAPEWLSGSPNLDCSNFLYFWVYLMFLNLLWVFVPAWIMYDSYVFFTSLKEPKSVDKGVNGDEQSKKDS